MADAKQSTPDVADLSFEAALGELEKLVQKMENGQLPLDQLISCYERGGVLARHCRAQLDKLEQKIEVLTGKERDNSQWQDFDAESARN